MKQDKVICSGRGLMGVMGTVINHIRQFCYCLPIVPVIIPIPHLILAGFEMDEGNSADQKVKEKKAVSKSIFR